MDAMVALRMAHPCIARECGHPTDQHLRTPELESAGETVLWCSACGRHEVRPARRFWRAHRSVRAVPPALPFQAV